jgi:hypothetical protein
MTDLSSTTNNLIKLSYNFTKPKFINKILASGLVLCSVFGLSLVQSANQNKEAEAMSFNSSWNSTISSISSSNNVTKTQNLGFSYQNPFLNYPNLNKAFQNDPEHTKHTVDRIAEYIEQNRSRDTHDNQANTPISAAFYYETAIKYHVPLDQMLAVARSESRFGSDCFTGSGNPTRICIYKNIFSIGLTETSSLGFQNWEDGVEAFGRLYQSRKERGYDDCQIWRIYNPNGEYCGKILSLAAKINVFLTQE